MLSRIWDIIRGSPLMLVSVIAVGVFSIAMFTYHVIPGDGATSDVNTMVSQTTQTDVGINDVIGLDHAVDSQTTATYTLNFRESLITWNGVASPDSKSVISSETSKVSNSLLGIVDNNNVFQNFPALADVLGGIVDPVGQIAHDLLGYFPANVSVSAFAPNGTDWVNDSPAFWTIIAVFAIASLALYLRIDSQNGQHGDDGDSSGPGSRFRDWIKRTTLSFLERPQLARNFQATLAT